MEILSWLSVLFSTVVILTGALYLYLNVAFFYWKERNIPYLRPTFPFGNLGDLLTGRKSMGETYADVYRKMNGMKFGGVYLMHRPQFIVRDPDMIRNCLLKDFECFHDHGFVFDEKIDPLTGNLFMLAGKKWKHLRTVLSPTFSSGKMKNMFKTMVDCGQGLTKFLDEYAYRKDDVEMKDVVARFTTDVIASCAFGIQCNCLKHPDAEFRLWGKRIVEQSLMDTVVGLLYILVPSIPIFFKLPLTAKSVSAFFRKVVRETVEFREKNTVKRNDFLQLLIDLKEQKQQQEGKSIHFNLPIH
jgi:cytochrome P450 family 6